MFISKIARRAAACAYLLAASLPAAALAQDETYDDAPVEEWTQEELEAAYAEWVAEFEAGLVKVSGDQPINGGDIVLHVPEDWYFLNPADSQAVLSDGWGNPPDDDVIGMLFPAEYDTMGEDSWGIAIYWEEDGYVSDKDASKIDYDDLMDQMQRDTRSENVFRKQDGYPTVELVGWAEPPVYDGEHNRMYWAKDLTFGGDDIHTLNYDMRILGRRGVLTLSYIATMGQLGEVRESRDEVLQMAEFTEGNRYADYQKGDKTADYGLAALIAGGAGLAVAKKAGLLGGALLLLKKFGWFLLVGIGALFTRLKGLFSKGNS